MIDFAAPQRLDDDGLRCAEIVRVLWDYLDDRLPSAQAERILAHLGACPACARYARFQEGFFAILRLSAYSSSSGKSNQFSG
jgi:anti-sigma factor RsiW